MKKTDEEFYAKLFTAGPESSHYPNVDEALRWGRLSPFLSEIANGSSSPLRILDVGCGRGWMTHLASDYGECEGIDPVVPVVNFARERYPGLQFHVGSLHTLLAESGFRPYDVVLCSEVIEHVPDDDKADFVRGLSLVLKPYGHLLVTTPRGEWFRAWLRTGVVCQPVEAWLSESALLRLVASHGFRVVRHDRVYIPVLRMSALHRIYESRRFASLVRKVRLSWLAEGLRFAAGIYQVWWFQLTNGRSSSTNAGDAVRAQARP